jgi:hypothetical protein
MAIDPISAGLGAVSLISGKNANKKAQSDAGKAKKSSQQLEQRVIKLWDTLFSRAENAEKSGLFDPEKRIAALEKNTAEYESRDLGNLAGALTVAGARPGDSEVGTRLDAVKVKYRKFLDNMRDEIRTSSFWDQQNAYMSANPSYLSGPMAASQNREQNALSQVQNPSGFLANLLPTLAPQKKQPNFSFLQNFGAFA